MLQESKGSVLFSRPSRVFKDDVDYLVTIFNKRKENATFSNCIIAFTEDGHIKILDTKVMKEWARFQENFADQDFSYQVLSTTRNILAFQYYQSTDPALKSKTINFERLPPKVVITAQALADKILRSKYYTNQTDSEKFQRNFDTYLLDMALHFGFPERHSKRQRTEIIHKIKEILETFSKDPTKCNSCDQERTLVMGNLSIFHHGSILYAGKKIDETDPQKELKRRQELKNIIKVLSRICGFEIKCKDEENIDNPKNSLSTIVKGLSITYPKLYTLFLLTSQHVPTAMGVDLRDIFHSRSPFSFDGEDPTRIMVAVLPGNIIRIEFTVRFVRPEDTCLKITGKAELFYNPTDNTFSTPKIINYTAEHKPPDSSKFLDPQKYMISFIRQQKAQYVLDQALNIERSQNILESSAQSPQLEETRETLQEQAKKRNSLHLERSHRVSRDNSGALVSPRAAEASSNLPTSPRFGEASPEKVPDLESQKRRNTYKGGRISLSQSQSVREALNELAKSDKLPPDEPEKVDKAEKAEKDEKSEKPSLQRTTSTPINSPRRDTFLSKTFARLAKPKSDEDSSKN